MTAPQEILLQPMTQQLLVQTPAEDWTGITSSAERRKLQNRLNKRSQYQRKRQQLQKDRVGAKIIDQGGLPTTSTSSREYALKGSPDMMFKVLRQACEVFETPDVSQKVFALANRAYVDYTMNAPRLSQLPLLITLNVNIAMAKNATIMGFKREILCLEESISPLNCSGPSQVPITYPRSLEPTTVQQNIVHHPWLDVFPFPRFRDNVIQACAANVMDDDDLCADISEISQENTEKPSLIVWGESSNPYCWEASILFFRKWGWLLKGCPEVLKATNKWRQSRGEKLLHWYGV
ncbi:hypothetical protein LTR93_011601 [Exophiala xenobiotica]|nr:hypothetical protein LTR93_011601 [Exophiala xenobiotica]